MVRLVPGAREHEPLVQSSALAQPGKLEEEQSSAAKRGCKEFNRAGVVDLLRPQRVPGEVFRNLMSQINH